MEEAEELFFGDRENPLFSWDGIFIANTFRKQGFSVKIANQKIIEKRKITREEIKKWFNTETSAYGKKMCETAGLVEIQKMVNLLEAACEKTIFNWESEIAFLTVEF